MMISGSTTEVQSGFSVEKKESLFGCPSSTNVELSSFRDAYFYFWWTFLVLDPNCNQFSRFPTMLFRVVWPTEMLLTSSHPSTAKPWAAQSITLVLEARRSLGCELQQHHACTCGALVMPRRPRLPCARHTFFAVLGCSRVPAPRGLHKACNEPAARGGDAAAGGHRAVRAGCCRRR
jgi:hypothetical protein